MNLEMIQPINTFVDTMISSKEMFEAVKVQISQKDAAVTNCIEKLKEEISNLLSEGIETEDEELQRLCDDTKKNLQVLLTGVTEDIRKTQKGTEFIKKYEQSFNVAVFGKVKAGKSYLGNFIMGNEIRDLGIETSYNKLPRPTVEVHDRGNISVEEKMAEITEEGQEGFGVAANEATSAIQLFRLGGLTWFDTPGIGSLTWDNEILAKEYVDNADLVIFACNSDAAGTRQDFTEMRTLHEKGKPFLLLLTQSDTLEEECDENNNIISNLVAKNPKDRSETENYMVRELKKDRIYLREKELLTISAKLAMTALEEGNQECFRESNMDKFLQVLTDITKTEGAKMKKETPNKRINATIGEILKRLDETIRVFQTYEKDLKEKQKNMSTHSDLLLSQMYQDCMNRVDILIRQKAAQVEETGTSVTAEELGTMLSEEIYKVLLNTCADEFTNSSQILSDYTVHLEGMSDIKQKKDVITYTVKTVERIPRDPEGLFEHIGHFFGKQYYNIHRDTEERFTEIDLGVNEQQVMSIAHGQLNRLFQEEVPGLMKKISERYLQQISKLFQASVETLKKTQAELEGLKC
jgi:tRNA U34 5-carboxymethylaminomethyl modifying GTPase MnmE/TrmE